MSLGFIFSPTNDINDQPGRTSRGNRGSYQSSYKIQVVNTSREYMKQHAYESVNSRVVKKCKARQKVQTASIRSSFSFFFMLPLSLSPLTCSPRISGACSGSTMPAPAAATRSLSESSTFQNRKPPCIAWSMTSPLHARNERTVGMQKIQKNVHCVD